MCNSRDSFEDPPISGISTSEWTLDYPPAFAYFEWLLSQVARYIEPDMLDLKRLGYVSWPAVYFQRSSVIVSELVLVYALQRYVASSPQSAKQTSYAASLSILLSPALLIIDHIHFQYNGLLYGILILSLVNARNHASLLSGGLFFAGLLCMKHIYLYLAPAYFVYLLRIYCLSSKSVLRVQFRNTTKLASGLLLISVAMFGPFVYWKQTNQMLGRLFPFARGLCHAYWAPNIWSMYSFTDRVLLLGTVALCGYSSFLFGWHVHEKAILLVIVPFSLLALKNRRYLGAFRPLAVAGHVSLFPLLYTAAEFPIKTVYTVFWLILFLLVFDRLAPVPTRPRVFLLDRFALLYITVSIPLILYCSLVHTLIFGERFEFLPLMFTSSYSAIGVVGSWIGFLVVHFTS
ncbi:MAG: hypothetical protein Q9203_000893 [Teloschistes exilis]